MRAQFVLSEIGVGLRRNLTMTIAVVVSVALSLALAGASLLVRDQVNSMKDYWYNKVEVSVFLCNKEDAKPGGTPSCSSGPVTPQQKSAIYSQLKKMPLVEAVYQESQQQAYEHFKQQNPNSEWISALTPASMQESFRVKLRDPQKFNVITSAFAGKPGVQEVQDEKAILDPLFGLLTGLQRVALVIMAMMLGVALLLIVNTVRVSAFSRRRETGIMRLVGASNYYVQMPFIAEASFAALLGGTLASAMLAVGKYVLIDHWLAGRLTVVHFIGWADVLAKIPMLLIAGVGMSGLAAFFTLRKYLKV